jgi:hypothetical protein
MVKAKQKIIYTYRGGVERGVGGSYVWRNGYSESGINGEVYYPWMTKKECIHDAKVRGAVAVFK